MASPADLVLDYTTPETNGDSHFVQWLARELALHPEQLALLVSRSELHLQNAHATRGLTKITTPSGQVAARTPFADATFDRVFLHRIVSNVRGSDWLAEARRVLRPGGLLFASTCSLDFNFAPLPNGGQMHLMKRTLRSVGFDQLELADRGPHHIVVSGACTFEPASRMGRASRR